jgi:hypothetical protein
MTNREKRERKKLMEQLDAQRQELESAGAHDAQELISSLLGVLSDPSVLVRTHSRMHRTPAPTYRLGFSPGMRMPQHALTISPAHRHDPPAECAAIPLPC